MSVNFFFFYKNIKKQQYAHTKSVARLVNSENLSKNNNKQQHAHAKSVARLVDCENWSKKKYIYFFFKKQHAHTKSVARLVDSDNWSNLVFFTKKPKNNNTRTQKVLLD